MAENVTNDEPDYLHAFLALLLLPTLLLSGLVKYY